VFLFLYLFAHFFAINNLEIKKKNLSRSFSETTGASQDSGLVSGSESQDGGLRRYR
jgi:hypothetical protein